MRNIIILFMLLGFANLSAQDIGRTLNSEIKSFGGDFKELMSSTSKLKWKDGLIPLGVVASALIASNYDEPLRGYVSERHSNSLDIYSNITNYGGEPITIVLLPGAIFAAGLVADNKQLLSTGRIAYESILLSGIITGAIKTIAGRARPYNNLGNDVFKGFSLNDDYQSFPSGHTTMAFAMATVFSHKIDQVWAYPVFYSFAASTAFARIYKDKHWLSDVVVGAAVGVLSATALLSAEKNRMKKDLQSDYEQTVYTPIIELNLKF